MGAGGEDVVLEFLARYVAMSERERDQALEELSPVDREALIALSKARTETAEADLLRTLTSGHEGLQKLCQVVEPDDLLTAISLAAHENPALVVEALFAAVVLNRGADEPDPVPIAVLREQWRRQVAGLISTPRPPERDTPPEGARP